MSAQRYPLLLSVSCLLLALALRRYPKRLEKALCLLPLLDKLPTYMWALFSVGGLLEAFYGVATFCSAAPLPFSIHALSHFAPLPLIIVIAFLTHAIAKGGYALLGYEETTVCRYLPVGMVAFVSAD